MNRETQGADDQDARARERALDTGASFIVQAPAGSGKTELLTQRFLALLAQVDRPEEVVAITFTRKASAEMRRRIVDALARARDEGKPGEAHHRRTYELARSVLVRDGDMGWQLLDNPGRLSVQTIDSLCSTLARQMPVLSRAGAAPGISDQPARLYREAARRAFASLEFDDEEPAPSVETLLEHLDNNLDAAIDLMSTMLAAREHWLPRIAGRDNPALSRAALEGTLKEIVTGAQRRLAASLPEPVWTELSALAAAAAENLSIVGKESPVRACQGLSGPPPTAAGSLPVWQGIAAMLLNAAGGIRKRVDVNIGFPPATAGESPGVRQANDDNKKRMTALLAQVAGLPDFLHRLVAVRSLPPVEYTPRQWRVLQALVEILPGAVAELKLVFRRAGAMDFTEVAHAAQRALGSPDEPTDLALRLDYRIRHILVDEFQDTSLTQFVLLQQLTGGWHPGDGRTLFLVGDPMQSIYRFREADVGLFLQARENGIGMVSLEPLSLLRNFRSRAGIVDWVNTVFGGSFPETEDAVEGAVTYAPAQAVLPADAGQAVSVHGIHGKDRAAEARKVVTLVQDAFRADPLASVAILVRARTQVAAIAPALRRAGLAFRAVEIETLAHRQAVRDVHALTLALSHLAHRPAWLAILRAPWCGLSLADLHALAGHGAERTVWECILDDARRGQLGADGRLRLARLQAVLSSSLAERGRRDLRSLVEGAWIALGGSACLSDPADPDNVAAYFELLDRVDRAGELANFPWLEEQLGKLYARPDPAADGSLEIMTIHKAKGLEFGTVILPGLSRPPPAPGERLLNWLELASPTAKGGLVVAPIRPTGGSDPIHGYVRAVDARRERNEQLRLLYVAATRAKRSLHLLADVEAQTEGGLLGKPVQSSLLARIWPAVEADFATTADVIEPTQDDDATGAPAQPLRAPRPLLRLPLSFAPPVAPPSAEARRPPAGDTGEAPVRFLWASETARQVGNVVHRTMQEIARTGPDAWAGRWRNRLEDHFQAVLGMRGVPIGELAGAARRAANAVRNTLADQRGRWILDPAHPHARSELALTGWIDDRLVSVVLDRSFTDADGIRWVIDYKTGSHEGGTVDGFLDNEVERYRGQLETYARLMRRLGPSPVRVALYFPMMQGWREWQP